MSDEHQVNLFARYERQLLSTGSSRSSAIPAVIITGFLGSGKTTLVQHVLRNRGSLRIAVLVNEVGQVDVDSELVNAKQSNAALGLSAADLSGGCVCCSRAEDLLTALRRIRNPPAAATAAGPAAAALGGEAASFPCDYLLVETSGAADAGPLSEALVACGFRLDSVVAVVDAEAGRDVLSHPVARAQVCCADVVVLNKCDLLSPNAGPGAGLGALTDLEDNLAEMAPGVRVVRARYGEVPLTAVLDVEPVGQSTAAAAPASAPAAGVRTGGAAPAPAGSSSGGGGGFLSHESVPAALGSCGYRLTSGPLTADGLAVGSSRHTRRRGPQPQPPPHPSRSQPPPLAGESKSLEGSSDSAGSHHQHGQEHHQHHDHPAHELRPAATVGSGPSSHQPHPHLHAHLHAGFRTESVTVLERPCSLVAFAEFVVRHLITEPTLLRSKGVLWFGERRTHRFTFHLSGRRRVECCQEGPFEGPPTSQLVFIGTSAEAMRRLRDGFLEQVAGRPFLKPVAAAPAPVSDNVPTSAAVTAAAAPAPTSPSVAGQELRRQGDLEPETHGCVGGVAAAAAAATVVLGAHERLELLDAGPWNSGGGNGSGGSGVGAGVIHFSTRGSALHGINSEDLNAEVMRRCNATGRLMLAGVTAPGRISAVTNVQARDRVLSLLLPLMVSGPQRLDEQAGLVLQVAEPVLRKAFAHVHNCKCDVASAMQVLK